MCIKKNMHVSVILAYLHTAFHFVSSFYLNMRTINTQIKHYLISVLLLHSLVYWLKILIGHLFAV